MGKHEIDRAFRAALGSFATGVTVAATKRSSMKTRLNSPANIAVFSAPLHGSIWSGFKKPEIRLRPKRGDFNEAFHKKTAEQTLAGRAQISELPARAYPSHELACAQSVDDPVVEEPDVHATIDLQPGRLVREWLA